MLFIPNIFKRRFIWLNFENKETYNEKRKRKKKIEMHWDFYLWTSCTFYVLNLCKTKDEVKMYSLWDIMAAPDELLKTY